MAEAIAYIFGKATELGQPCVINMSLNQNGGSHDGDSVVEGAIDRLLTEPGRAYVGAAGNEHIWRGHAAGQLATGARRTLQWKAGGEYSPRRGTVAASPGRPHAQRAGGLVPSRDELRMRLIAPGGETTDTVLPGEEATHEFASGNSAFIASDRFSPLNGDAHLHRGQPGDRPAGRHRRLAEWAEAVSARNGRFDAWIERDARDANNKFGDQSFFVGADFDEQMTLGTPATARRSIAVANYDHVTVAPQQLEQPWPDPRRPGQAGGGRPRDQHRLVQRARRPGRQRRAAAPGADQEDRHQHELPARRRHPGAAVPKPDLTAVQARSILVASASAPPGVVPFDIAWGFGRVDAGAAVRLVDLVD